MRSRSPRCAISRSSQTASVPAGRRGHERLVPHPAGHRREGCSHGLQLEQSNHSYNEPRASLENKDAVTHKMFQDIIVEEEQHSTPSAPSCKPIDYGEEYLALQSAGGSTSKSFNPGGGE
ncbi:MAG: hypothetical protein ACLRM8_07525 [Alistipes sp.]